MKIQYRMAAYAFISALMIFGTVPVGLTFPYFRAVRWSITISAIVLVLHSFKKINPLEVILMTGIVALSNPIVLTVLPNAYFLAMWWTVPISAAFMISYYIEQKNPWKAGVMIGIAVMFNQMVNITSPVVYVQVLWWAILISAVVMALRAIGHKSLWKAVVMICIAALFNPFMLTPIPMAGFPHAATSRIILFAVGVLFVVTGISELKSQSTPDVKH